MGLGRTGGAVLNGQYRKLVGWAILGRKLLDNLYVRSALNASDDPSRHVALRAPKPAPRWLAKHLKFEPPLISIHWTVPFGLRLVVEAFAGHAGFTRGCIRAGLQCGPPLEAYPGKCKVAVSDSDLENPEVVSRLVSMITCGMIWFMHFGIPCRTWGTLARLKYSRTRANPAGNGTNEEELRGNRQAEIVCMLCKLLHATGGHYSIENPMGSTLLWFDKVLELRDSTKAFIISLDQCTYGLQLPGAKKFE